MAPKNGRRGSKLKSSPIHERIIQVLPRAGLASDAQLEHLARTYPQGGYESMQAILNLMDSGVRDCVAWDRPAGKPQAICSVTSQFGDSMELQDPVNLPPTAGCSLHDCELCLEKVMAQLSESVAELTKDALQSTEPVMAMARKLPSQVCTLVQRIRFTEKVDKACISPTPHGTLKGTFMKELTDLKAQITATLRLSEDECPDEERGDLQALQVVMAEQFALLRDMVELKTSEEIKEKYKNTARMYYDKDTDKCTLEIDKMSVTVATNVYSPGPCPLVTTEFTNTLRFAYIQTMVERSRVLVLVGNAGAGKTQLIADLGRLLGTLPCAITATADFTDDPAWWERRFQASLAGSGGNLTPFILSQAHKAPEKSLKVALQVASQLGVALCFTMAPGTIAERLKAGILEGASIINMQDPELNLIAGGLLAAHGVKKADDFMKPFECLLLGMTEHCSKQPHYDFGPRTLAQICGQIGDEIRGGNQKTDEVKICHTILERCLLPKLLKNDVKVFQRLLKQCFGVEMTEQNFDDRWGNVVDNICSITDCEPDCMILPVPESDEANFLHAFDKSLNATGHVKVMFPKLLAECDPEELMGKMPAPGEPVKDGILVSMLRNAILDYPDIEKVWILIKTGPVTERHWEYLRELLNDSGVLNLATGEQVRLSDRLRYLFLLPNAGQTSVDTFSRSAIVYTHPDDEEH
jgi:hypothetical protein